MVNELDEPDMVKADTMVNELGEPSEEKTEADPFENKGTRTKGEYKKERKKRTNLSFEEQIRLEKIEEIIKPLADSRRDQGRIRPRGALTRAVAQLQEAVGVTVGVDNVREMADKYNAQREKYQSEPDRWCECFIHNRGRPLGSHEVLTEDHIAAITLGLMNRDRVAVFSDGEKQTVALQPGIDVSEDVYEYAKAIEPDLPSIHTVRREVKRLVDRDPAYLMYITDQLDDLLKIGMPRFKSDVSEVDEHWVLDEHFIPVFIQHNGVICTASMLDIVDQFSDFHIHCVVFPTKNKTEEGHIYRASFTIEDTASFYATAMHKPDRSPGHFYNDNDARFTHMEQYLPRLTAPSEPAIKMHKSIPGQPQGRGGKERMYRTLKRFFKRLPGYYNKRNRFTIRKAIKDPTKLLTLEKLQQEVEAFFNGENGWNDQFVTVEIPDEHGQKQKVKATRRDLYYGRASGRTCPRVWRLAFLPLEQQNGWVSFSHWGFYFDGKEYEPIVRDGQSMHELAHRWANAALRNLHHSNHRQKPDNQEQNGSEVKHKVRYYAVKLFTGWAVEVELEGQWYTALPKSEQPLTVDDRMTTRNRFIKELRERQKIEFEQLVQGILEKHGVLPERLNTTVRGHYRMPEKDEPGDQDTSEKPNETPPSPASFPSPESPGASPPSNQHQGKTPPQPDRDTSSKDTDWDDLF